MVTMTEDFTKLPVGSLVSGRRPVVRCPLCRRQGALERLHTDAWRCVHVESSLIHTDGMLVEPRDHCELAQTGSAGLEL